MALFRFLCIFYSKYPLIFCCVAVSISILLLYSACLFCFLFGFFFFFEFWHLMKNVYFVCSKGRKKERKVWISAKVFPDKQIIKIYIVFVFRLSLIGRQFRKEKQKNWLLQPTQKNEPFSIVFMIRSMIYHI